MLVYREKNNLFYKLHPVTLMAYVCLIIALSMVYSHPLYLLGILFAIGLVMISSDNLQEWKGYLKFSILMILVILIVNVIVVNRGATVLYRGGRLPVIGRIKITLEALTFAIGMGIRLLIIISGFCFYTYTVHPDGVLRLFSKWGNKSVLVITLATRLFPLMIEDFRRISEIQRCRGVKLNSGRWYERAKNTLPIFSVLLLSSLERSFQIAESMHARGYGSGDRSSYKRNYYRPRDYLILMSVFFAITLCLWAYLMGLSTYKYYPRLQSLDIQSIVIVGILTFILSFPALLNWGWKKWKTLRLKI